MQLELEDVALARGSLRGISLTLRGGELTALQGPSGIGKTSLLRAIVRLDEPAEGRVRVDGTDARELDPRALRRRVGFVAQSPAMLPGTVRDNLAFALPEPTEDARSPARSRRRRSTRASSAATRAGCRAASRPAWRSPGR